MDNKDFDSPTKNHESSPFNDNDEIRFRTLVNNSHDGISLLGPDGKLSYVTPSVERIMGYTYDEILGVDPTTICYPDDIPRMAELLDSLAGHPGKTESIIYRMRHKDGSWRWLDSNITNCLDEPGINAYIYNYKDVTDKIVAEEKIKEERKNRDDLVDSIGEAMWSFDTDLRLIDANQAFKDFIKLFTGLDLKQGDSLLFEGYFDSKTIEQWTGWYKMALAGNIFVEENHIHAPLPSWYQVSFTPIITNGVITGAVCFSKNITARKLDQLELKNNTKLLADSQRLAHIGTWEMGVDFSNPNNSIPKWTEEAYRILGYEPYSVTPSFENFKARVHPDDMEYALQVVNNAIETNSRYSMEHRIIRPDGSVRWIISEGEITFDETGKPVKLVGTNQDITERKLMEEEREKIAADLLQRNKDLEQFTYIVSHNLRSPVSNIIGLSDVLKDEESGELRDMLMVELNNSVSKLDTVIKDLSFILQTKREITHEREAVCFTDLVSDIKTSIYDILKSKNVIIESDFSAVDHMPAIKSYLYSIFYNLITNSIKYRQPDVDPHIIIKSQLNAHGIELTFTDNGMGIDLEKQGGNVFGMYKRFHQHTEGKGMGLFMVKNQVESIGGSISIESKVNKGTTFKIIFKINS